MSEGHESEPGLWCGPNQDSRAPLSHQGRQEVLSDEFLEAGRLTSPSLAALSAFQVRRGGLRHRLLAFFFSFSSSFQAAY